MLLRFRFCPKKNLGGVAGDTMVLLTITRWRQASHPQNFLLLASLSDALQGPEFANRAVSSSCVISVLGEQSQQSY